MHQFKRKNEKPKSCTLFLVVLCSHVSLVFGWIDNDLKMTQYKIHKCVRVISGQFSLQYYDVTYFILLPKYTGIILHVLYL